MTVDLYQSLLPYGDTYNELSADGVTPRSHWAHLMESLREIGPEELERRWSRAERRIRENGITYNIYSDPLGANRPWKIDFVPFLIPAEEWRFIEAGIIQRARLLSLILEDLYGSQNLVLNGHFPAALLYANPAPTEGWARNYCMRYNVSYLVLSHREPVWNSLSGWPASLPVTAREPGFVIFACRQQVGIR